MSENRTLPRCCLTLRPKRSEFSYSQTWFVHLWSYAAVKTQGLENHTLTSWAVLSSGHCQDLWGPVEPGLGTVPVHCSDTCLPSALPSQPTSCVSFNFRSFIKVTSYGDTSRSCPQVWRNPSISVTTESTGCWEIHCTAQQWFNVYCILQLGIFARNLSHYKSNRLTFVILNETVRN